MRRPRADREEKRVTHGRDMMNNRNSAAIFEANGQSMSTAMRYVTKGGTHGDGPQTE
jgi:hypothetical protein